MIKVIKNCAKCISLSNNVAERPAMKHIIPEGPHYRYQSDIWELSKKALKNITYKYILEIKDCFSKWMWCYPLENKEGQTILRKIKSYFLAFGPPKIFQTDNGLEFCNIITDLYLENMGVKHIRSSPRYPESNGQIESQHKTLQRQLNLNLDNIKNNEDLFEIIYDTLYIYNYKTKHSSTGYYPITLKDTRDLELINEVKLNITKKYMNFHKNDEDKYKIGDKYLLIENGFVSKKSNLINKPKIKKLTFSIPVTVVSSNKGGLIKIKIEKENKFYNYGEIYKVNYKLLKKCNDVIWNQFINYN